MDAGRKNLKRALLMALDIRTHPMPLSPAVARDQEAALNVIRWALERFEVLTLDMVNEQPPSEALQTVRHAVLVHVEKTTPINWEWFELGWKAYCAKHPEARDKAP